MTFLVFNLHKSDSPSQRGPEGTRRGLGASLVDNFTEWFPVSDGHPVCACATE